MRKAGRYSQAEVQKIVKDANAHLPPGDFNEIQIIDPLGTDPLRIAELEELMNDVMKWMDVSVSSTEAAELCDRMEDLLLRGKKE